jgi:hypothetical protein
MYTRKYIPTYTHLIHIEHTDKYLYKKEFLQSCKYIHKKYNIQSIYIYLQPNKKQKKTDIVNINLSKEDIVGYIKNNIKNTQYIYINTLDESLVDLTTEVKKALEQPYTWQYHVFSDKSKERSLTNNSIAPFYHIYEQEEITSYNNTFPVIIKPSQWAQSSGVALINNKKDLRKYIQNIQSIQKKLSERNYHNQKFVVEEYLPWDMYTVTYFVRIDGSYIYDQICKVDTLVLIWIPDFAILKRTIKHNIIDPSLAKKIDEVIQKTIQIYDIKNTFIHQEFRLDYSNNPKNIEINARIWWYRLELYQKAINRNLFDYIFCKRFQNKKIKKNVAIYSIFPNKNAKKLIAFNTTILEKIKQLNSVKIIKTQSKKIGKICWRAKHGYTRLWSIIVENKNIEIFEKDCKKLEHLYKKITILSDPDLQS